MLLSGLSALVSPSDAPFRAMERRTSHQGVHTSGVASTPNWIGQIDQSNGEGTDAKPIPPT